MPWILAVTLIIGGTLFLVFGYTGKRIIQSILLLTNLRPAAVRLGVMLVCGAANLFPLAFLFSFLIGGRAVVPLFSGESSIIDLLLVYPFWFALVIAVNLFFLFLLLDAARLMTFPLYRSRKLSWHSAEARIRLVLVLLVSLYSIFAIVRDTWTVRVTDEDIALPAGAGDLDGLVIALFSDVQGDGRTTDSMLRDYVSRISALRPDLVVFTGDLVTSGIKYIEPTARILGALQAPYGCLAVIGDHDMFSNKQLVWKELCRNGFTVLEDTTAFMPVRGVPIAISAVTETYVQRIGTKDLDSILSRSQSVAVRILLAHQPSEKLARAASQQHQTLFLAGHTHGGGIAFGIPGLFLLAPSRLESKYMSGRHALGETTIIVTNGLGLTLSPIRYHAPAEITVLRLRARTS